jgi:hypothetical protein
MISKVSDFKLAESVLKPLCQDCSCAFKDVDISFDEEKPGILFIGETKNVSHTIYKIVDLYLQNSEIILGRNLIANSSRKESFLIGLASYLRGLIYADNTFSDYMDGLHRQKLYQRPFVWLAMKDIICPVFKKSLKNVDIVCGDSPCIDIARFYEKDELQKVGKSNDPFIFVNVIDHCGVQNAFIFIEAIKCHGLSPVEVIKEIYDGELCGKFYGLLKLSLKSEKNIVEFENVLLNILGIDLSGIDKEEKSAYVKTQKVAQNMYPETASQWWYLGITEKLLDPTRGSDWSTHMSLERYIKDFWNHVEKIREKKAKKGGEWTSIPFNKLLELKVQQTTEKKTDTNRVLQHALSDERIW